MGVENRKKKSVSFGNENNANGEPDISKSPDPNPTFGATAFTSILKQVGRYKSPKILKQGSKGVHEERQSFVNEKETNIVENDLHEFSSYTQLLPCDSESNDRGEIPLEYVSRVCPESGGESNTDSSVSENETQPSEHNKEDVIEIAFDSGTENNNLEMTESLYDLILKDTYTNDLDSSPDYLHFPSPVAAEQSDFEDEHSVGAKGLSEDFVHLSQKFVEVTNIFEEFLTGMKEENKQKHYLIDDNSLAKKSECDDTVESANLHEGYDSIDSKILENNDHLYVNEDQDTVQKLISNKTSKLISDIEDVYSTMKKERECFQEAKQDKVQWKIKNLFSSYINDLYEIIKGEKETKQSSPPEIRNQLLKNVDDAYIILKTKKEGKVVEDEKDYHTKFFSFIDAVYNDIKVNKQHLDSG